MSFWDNVKKFAQPYSDEEYDDYDEDIDSFEEEEQEAAPRSRRTSPFATATDTDLGSAAPLLLPVSLRTPVLLSPLP